MKIPLTLGFYEAQSVIADAQRCVNLYPEVNPADSTFPFTHYPTPGLRLLSSGGVGSVRCTYRTSKGVLYMVVGAGVYLVASDWSRTQVGTIPYGTGQVSMSDNGLVAVLVDGSTNGWYVNLTSQDFGPIVDSAFYGANRVCYLDTRFLFNRPGTKQFYFSPSNWVPGIAFNPLDIASKTGSPDPISALIVLHREIWLVGELTTEIWYNSGAADSPYEGIPGAFIEHGSIAVQSLATQDLRAYWLSQDRQGNTVVFKGTQYMAIRISTHAIENELRKYTTVSDAIGMTYQQNGHTFYVLIFPAAGKTWVYDESVELWHERVYTNPINGTLERHRMNCVANAYGEQVVGDYKSGNLYALDLDKYTDDGDAITRIRSFPQLADENDRIIHSEFNAEMDVGSSEDTTPTAPPLIRLRWSDTKGMSWGNYVTQSLGATGQYLTDINWSRLGLARNRVYELSWSANAKTALNGSYVRVIKAAS